MEVKNPKWNGNNTIDCEIEHPVYGWIPFTAQEDDVEKFGQLVYKICLEMGPEPFVPEKGPTQEEILQELSKNIRHKRNDLLASCDWTQLPDAPVDQTAWATYRQELRDITDQVGFPETVVWPTPPQ